MRALIRSNTGRPFRRAGREFPPQAIEVGLSDLSEAELNAILGESRLVVQMLGADGDDQAGDDQAGDDQADQTQRPGGEQQQGDAAATGTAEGAAPQTRRARRS